MKILQSDIDALIVACSELQVIREAYANHPKQREIEKTLAHVRKVYMLLLCASNRGQLEFRDLLVDGVPEDSNIALAVRSFAKIS